MQPSKSLAGIAYRRSFVTWQRRAMMRRRPGGYWT
jgi:hypothetical protein